MSHSNSLDNSDITVHILSGTTSWHTGRLLEVDLGPEGEGDRDDHQYCGAGQEEV